MKATASTAMCPLTTAKPETSDLAFSLASEVHIKGNGGEVFLPLCAKPSFLALLDKHESLLEDYMRHCLTTTDADILIFIADGDVMGEALRATGTSAARAQRLIDTISARIRAKVDVVVAKLNDVRIRGVVHWEDVASGSRFRKMMAKLEQMMACDVDNSLTTTVNKSSNTNLTAGVKQIQHHVKTLVKNLFTQRVAKAHAAGCRMTNVFTGDGLAMVSGARYLRRYRHLERACLLELSCILVGLEHGKQTFTEMQYLTNDPRGMTYIAGCLQQIRQTIVKLPASPNTACLKEAAEPHGITFIKFLTGVLA